MNVCERHGKSLPETNDLEINRQWSQEVKECPDCQYVQEHGLPKVRRRGRPRTKQSVSTQLQSFHHKYMRMVPEAEEDEEDEMTPEEAAEARRIAYNAYQRDYQARKRERERSDRIAKREADNEEAFQEGLEKVKGILRELGKIPPAT